MSFQWIGIALVKLPDGAAIKSVLIDLEIGTEKQLRWEFFHRKSYSLGSRVESLVTNRTFVEAPASGSSGWSGWKELCLGIVVNGIHCDCTSTYDSALTRCLHGIG
jgi:hypothetical protein